MIHIHLIYNGYIINILNIKVSTPIFKSFDWIHVNEVNESSNSAVKFELQFSIFLIGIISMSLMIPVDFSLSDH